MYNIYIYIYIYIYIDLTKEEHEAIKSLRSGASIVIKEINRGSGVVVWGREDYLIEAEKQPSDKKVYGKLEGDIENPLIKIVKSLLLKVKTRGDVSNETMD